MTKKRKKKQNKKMLGGIFAIILVLGVSITYAFLNRDKLNFMPKFKDIVNPIPEPKQKLKILDLESDTRPYAVMINNNSAVWSYQSGLNDAYMVYELLVEGGITREMALFKDSDTPKIQSIRSSRHYFLDYALENDAIYVHWGWSPQAQSDIKTLGINNINGLTYENIYFFRDNEVKAGYEHKGYITSENIKKAVDKLGYRSTTKESPLLSYSITPVDYKEVENVKSAGKVEIKFSTGYTAIFDYDKETKRYAKTQNKTELYDFTSKERITTKNIIVYQIGYSGISGDEKGRQDADNIGSGEGYYITEGLAIPITWEKSSRSGKTKYKLKDGSELVVNDGNTFIELQPRGNSVNIIPLEEDVSVEE